MFRVNVNNYLELSCAELFLKEGLTFGEELDPRMVADMEEAFISYCSEMKDILKYQLAEGLQRNIYNGEIARVDYCLNLVKKECYNYYKEVALCKN